MEGNDGIDMIQGLPGYKYIEFSDTFDNLCSLSLDDKKYMLFGVVNNDKEDLMSLTREQVRKLLPYFQRFVDTGKLFEE